MAETSFRVGFVGLGIMGAPMAANCLKAGFPLTVYNRTGAKTKPLQEAGASVASNPAAVAEASDVVISCVSDSPDVLEVILNANHGVLAGARAGMVAVDCSTVSPEVAKRCTHALGEKGAGFLDAPISGGDTGAKQGTLSIMVGGGKAHFDEVLPVLEAMGKTITHCGPSGAGYTVKLCNQILCGLHLLAASEALSLASGAGIDLATMVKAVSSGAAGSWMLANVAPKMISGDLRPGFFVDYQLKDLHLATEAAHRSGVPLLGTPIAEAMFRAASGQGLGRCGTQALFQALTKLAAASPPSTLPSP